MTFEALVKLVEKANRANRRISCIYHPDAKVDSIQTPNWGGIRVEAGPVGYRLNTGEIFAGEVISL